MKKYLFAIIFAIGISISAGQTYAQSNAFRIDVPFAFTANNKTLPAGTYVVSPERDSRTVWTLRRANNKPVAFLMAGSLSSTDGTGNVRFTFRRYGDRNFLIGFTSFSYQVGLARSASEKAFRRSFSDVAKNAPAIVETVSTK